MDVRRLAVRYCVLAAWRPASVNGDRGGAVAGTAPIGPDCYRYWPVLLAVSMDRPASVPLPPETSVRM